MKKKFAFMLLAVMIAVSCVFGLTACSGNENEHVHSLEYHAKVEPTCTTDGNIEYWSCSGCGKNFADEDGKTVVSSTILKASGHSLSYQNRVEPTCTTNGNIEHFSCSNCGKAFLDENAETEISDIVIPSSHKPNNVLDYNNDYHWYVCEACNEKVDVTVHSFNTVGICECGHKRNPEELDYVLSDDKSYYILAGIGRSTDNRLYVADSVNGKPVKEIKAEAFKNNATISSVYIPDSVTTIGDDAFRGCNSLITVTIGNGLTTTGSYIFQGCPIENAFIHTTALNLLPREKLLNVKITGGESIRKYAFSGSSLLQSITIPNSVTTIESDAFSGCSALEEVNYLGDIAGWCNINFVDAEANPLYVSRNAALIINNEVITNLVIPDGVTRIGNYAFYDYKSLTCVTIPNSVTSIGTYAFMGCHITNATIPTVAIGAISKGNLTKLTITGEGSIKIRAFNGYDLLESITISDGITSIGSDAFKDCSALANVTLPSTLTHIDSGAFAFCRAISNVHYLGDVAGWCNVSFVDNASSPIQKSTNLYIDGKFVTDVIIPDGVATIKDYAFYNCYSLASVTLPDSVTSIGKYAFYYNTALQGVTIPNSVTSIGSNAFYNCAALINVTIGSGVTNIENFAFMSCTALKEIFYKGTSEGWGKINLNSYNVTIENVTKYWYSETEPTTVGNYWHYDVDGKTIVKW